MIASPMPVNEDVSTHATSDRENEILRQWLINAYYPTYPGKITGSIEYLHTTINWTLTVLGAIVAMIMAGRSVDPLILWVGTLAILVTCVHLFARSARGYINIMRWATIENSLVLYVMSTGFDKATALDEAIRCIEEYHLNWVCPLSRKDVFYKLIFEFGYAYFFTICLGVTIYVATLITINYISIALTVLSVFFVALEFCLLLRSPYMRKVAPHTIAQAQR